MIGIDWYSPKTWLIIEGLFVVIPTAIVLPFFLVLGGTEATARVASFLADSTGAFGLSGRLGAFVLAVPKFAVMMLKSVRRNLVRTSLTYVATFLLVSVVLFIMSVLTFLDAQTKQKAGDVKVIVTEKFQVPSQMPPSYEAKLADAAADLPGGLAADRVNDTMSWSFVACATDPDPTKWSLDNILVFFVMRPPALLSMMDEIQLKDLTPENQEMMQKNVAAMQSNIQGIIVGVNKLRAINKKVGERIKVVGLNYKDLDFEVEIVGTFPAGSRYDDNAILNTDYFYRSLDAYERAKGKRHPLADRSLNLYWVRFPNQEGFERYADVISQPSQFSSPAVKVEMISAAVSTFLDAYDGILSAMRYVMAPAIVVTMIVIVANAISIGVRERQKEMAVMKVLGFRPWQILILVLGEALLIGTLSGAISAFVAWFVVNKVLGGISLMIGFFGKFRVANDALWWGPAIGALTAFLGSFFPAWSARTVKASEVFSKVT
jgi:putative ABC transport system permease protein